MKPKTVRTTRKADPLQLQLLDDKKKSPDVAPQYLGFALQATQMLQRLLKASPGQVVSLELLGDVSVAENGTTTASIESKSSTSGRNPVADRAVDLWKTLANWIRGAQEGIYSPRNTTFLIYTSRPFPGRIIQLLSEAKTVAEANAAYDQAKALFFGDEMDEQPTPPIAQSIKEHVETVFEADRNLVCSIFQNIEYEYGSGKSQYDLLPLLEQKAIPEELLNDVSHNIQGWLKEQVDTSIEEGRPATISARDCLREIALIVHKLDKRTMLASFATDPSHHDIDNELKTRTYVRQLDLIQCDDGLKINAVIDFLKAATDRTRWADIGHVDKSSFVALEKSLIRFWFNTRHRLNDASKSKQAEERGRELYLECSNHHTVIDGLPVPDYFCPGSYHALAEDVRLGWHPDYEHLLKP